MSVQPNTTRLPNVDPYNTFIINCIATVPESVISPKMFNWSRLYISVTGQQTMQAVTMERRQFKIASTNLDRPTSSSLLTVTETTPGNYTYHCQVHLEGHNNIIMNETDVHPINVTGMCCHTVDINIMDIIQNFIFVMWHHV